MVVVHNIVWRPYNSLSFPVEVGDIYRQVWTSIWRIGGILRHPDCWSISQGMFSLKLWFLNATYLHMYIAKRDKKSQRLQQAKTLQATPHCSRQLNIFAAIISYFYLFAQKTMYGNCIALHSIDGFILLDHLRIHSST